MQGRVLQSIRVPGQRVVTGDFVADEVCGSIAELFEQRVVEHPDRMAVRDGSLEWTYREVKARADLVCDALLNLLGPEPEPVGVYYAVEAGVVPAIYGVLAAGKFYVPLDPGAPPARLRQLLDDTGCRIVLTRGELRTAAHALSDPGVRVLDTDCLSELQTKPLPRPQVGPGALAYVIHTSGSTGRPKGVMQTHANVLFDMRRQGHDLGVEPGDCYGLLFSAASSASACSLFGALLNGAALSCYDIKRRGIAPMAAWLSGHQISICDISVATLRLFAATLSGGERFPSLRMIAPGGEPLYRHDIELCRRVFTGDCVVQNSLGTTETRTATQYFISRDMPLEDALVPVGFPVVGKEILLIDSHGMEADEGEIAIRSRFLSPGYWRRPDLTAAVFHPNPGSDGRVTYLTGDLGKRLPDGRLVHLGRKDFQVKINGYRVEIAEVENVLLSAPGVEDAAVVARRSPDGGLRLIAFVVPRPGNSLTAEGLRGACAVALPSFSIPAEFRRIAALPKTDNGKLNRKVLTESGAGEMLSRSSSVPPRDATERALCVLWERLLGRSGIGIEDDFFVLGGDSVMAMSCLLEIEESFGRRLDPSAFVPTATVARLAHLLREETGPRFTIRLIPLKDGGRGRPLYLVHSIAGSLLHYREFLAAGDFGRPVFGLQCPTSVEGDSGTARMEPMASGYVTCLRAFQPQGPYALAGHSFGGVLAFEIARQLEACGQQVSFLGLIDSWRRPTLRTMPGPMECLGAFVRNLPHWMSDVRSRRPLQRRWEQMRHRIATRASPPAERNFEFRNLSDDLKRLADRHLQASAAYRPQPIQGTLQLFVAQTRPALLPIFPDHAWRPLVSGGVRLTVVRGDHSSLLADPAHASAFAQVFCDILRSSDDAFASGSSPSPRPD